MSHDAEPRRQWLLAALSTVAASAMSGCATPAPVMPQVDTGRLERLPALASRHVSPRHVDVWLPPGYRADGRHAVLLMHDGQMLYDARTTWNRQAWDVPPTAARLMATGSVRPFVVVGVWNSGETRFADYFPQAFLAEVPDGPVRQGLMTRAMAGGPRSDAYLRFLVEELLPAVRTRYGTATSAADTVVCGSSMGGLISLYAMTEYPQVFGGAACLSTHWIGIFERNPEVPAAALAYLRRRLPPPGTHRLYLDRGTVGLDGQYDQAQGQVDALLRERGWGPPLTDSRVFEGDDHDERSWARRLHLPLTHLLRR